MDLLARNQLIAKAIGILEAGDTLLAVSLDDFFEGNTDEQSIGVNLLRDQHIGIAGFRRVLYDIQERPEVQGVFIELVSGEVPDPGEELDFEVWPPASVAFVVTSAPLSDVAAWVSPLQPRDIALGWHVEPGVKTPIAPEHYRSGHHVVRVWLL